MKGKDMILSNFLLRQTHEDSNPHDIIPIYPLICITYYMKGIIKLRQKKDI